MKYISSLLLVLAYSTCTSSEGTVHLERGGRGVVPCPLIASERYTLDEIDAVYWYYGQKRQGSLLISYFRGTVAPQNGIPDDVYDINSVFSLVIERVGPTDEGIYFCQIKPKLMMDETEHVTVHEKVSLNPPFPIVIGCNKRSPHPMLCEVEIRDDGLTDNLTCRVDTVKPAVELRWFRVLANGFEERVAASQTVTPVVLAPNKGAASINNTSSTSLSMKLPPVKDYVTYRCEAHGVAVRNGSHVIVNFVKAPSTTVTYSSIQSSEKTDTGSTACPSGTMAALTDQSLLAAVIALAVVIAILFVYAVTVTCLYVVIRQQRRHKNTKYAPEIASYETVPTRMDA